jgi:hypothetical protein
MKELAGPALKAVTEGYIHIHPGDKFLATYKYWLENVEDWCISRQLWWGQQIPAWYAPDGSFRVATTREEAYAQFDARKAPFTAADLRQDEDVLDTWFSSWLWPIEVFKGVTIPATRYSVLLPYGRTGHRSGHHLLLGSQDDHGRAVLFPRQPADGQAHTLPGRLLYRHGTGQAGP